MELTELIKVVKDNSLIETISDIEFLFLDYAIEDENLPINYIIDNALTWAYENDELYDFYSEHSDFLIESDKADFIIGCSIIINTSIQTSTSYELYCFESKNKLYYRVIGSGENSDCWDTRGIFKIVEKNSNINDIISLFKGECYEVYTVHDEFDIDELPSDGHTIEFYTE